MVWGTHHSVRVWFEVMVILIISIGRAVKYRKSPVGSEPLDPLVWMMRKAKESALAIVNQRGTFRQLSSVQRAEARRWIERLNGTGSGRLGDWNDSNNLNDSDDSNRIQARLQECRFVWTSRPRPIFSGIFIILSGWTMQRFIRSHSNAFKAQLQPMPVSFLLNYSTHIKLITFSHLFIYLYYLFFIPP